MTPSNATILDVNAETFQKDVVDRSRTIRLPDGRRVPRPLETIVRYPASGSGYPLIVFGHGFALTPAVYAHLLRAGLGTLPENVRLLLAEHADRLRGLRPLIVQVA